VTEGPKPDLSLAVDIGGTKIAVGLVDADGGVLWSEQLPTPQGTDAAALFGVVAELVALAFAAASSTGAVVAVGVGCGGPIVDDLVSPVNIPAWRRFPLVEELRSLPEVAARQLPVAIDNDAKALALGEGWRGRARGVDNFLAMVVSTGVGGGIVLDGRLLEGAAGNAGHIGHVIVEPAGRRCGCGADGCLEAEASGTSIAAITGRPASEADDLVRQRTGRLVGRAIASVANLLDLRLALVGGSVALGFGASFFLAAQHEIDRCAQLDFSRGTRIEPVGLLDRAPLVGAGAVGWRAAGRQILGR
jgi:glucokinase